MTKTLTEQWREGTLKEGWYYLKVKSELANYPVIAECVINYSSLKPYSDFYEYDDSHVEEVIGPVPSYDEYNELKQDNKYLKSGIETRDKQIEQLEKKLEIATKSLKDYANSDEWELVDSKNVYWSRKRFPYPWRIAGKALKEMEGVK